MEREHSWWLVDEVPFQSTNALFTATNRFHLQWMNNNWMRDIVHTLSTFLLRGTQQFSHS